jgi:hypothetical protein
MFVFANEFDVSGAAWIFGLRIRFVGAAAKDDPGYD